MITKIHFENFKTLRNTELKLGRLNVLVGPNGSGKSTALFAIRLLAGRVQFNHPDLVSINSPKQSWKITAEIADTNRLVTLIQGWANGQGLGESYFSGNRTYDSEVGKITQEFSQGVRHFEFDASKMRKAVPIKSQYTLTEDGSSIAGFLDYLRDNGRRRFDALVEDLHRVVPEYDDVGLYVPVGHDGSKAFKLRITGTEKFVNAENLSEGTLYLMAVLALAHQPDPPSIVCIEEPERGIHPRALKEVYSAIVRLCYPEKFGDKRPAAQVICTTHSPYFIDLFKDAPECITVCEKAQNGEVTFKNLADDPVLKEQIGDLSLGEVWYSGVLGGVPVSR